RDLIVTGVQTCALPIFQYMPPEDVDQRHQDAPTAEILDGRLEETVRWWRGWRKRARLSGPFEKPAIRSAIVLKSMQNAPTGGMRSEERRVGKECRSGWA